MMTTVFEKTFFVADQAQQYNGQDQVGQSSAGAWHQHMEQEQIAAWLRLGVTEHNLKLTSHQFDVQEARILSSNTMVNLDQMRAVDPAIAEHTFKAADHAYPEQNAASSYAQHEMQELASTQEPLQIEASKSDTTSSGKTSSAPIGQSPHSNFALEMATMSEFKNDEKVWPVLTIIPLADKTSPPVAQQWNIASAPGRETLESATSIKNRGMPITRVELDPTPRVSNLDDEEIATSEVTERVSVNQTEHGKLNFHVEKDGTDINLWIGSAKSDVRVVAMLIERLLSWANSQKVVIKRMIWNGASYEQEQWAGLLSECKESSYSDHQPGSDSGLMKYGLALTTITNRITNYGN